MLTILTPEQMKEVDLKAINEIGIPSIVLMENAAKSSSLIIKDFFEHIELNINKIAIFCGSGNNGGDGFAIARHLSENYEVSVFKLGSTDKMSSETLINYKILENLDIEIIEINDINDFEKINFDFDCIIDAMIGIGGTENIKGIVLDVLKFIYNFDTLKIAIDVPTGLNSLTGKANEYCFKSDLTITMQFEKIGLRIADGLNYSGEIATADIGAPRKLIENYNFIKALEPDDLSYFLPKRKLDSSKFDYGKALLIAGSKNYPGAAALSANGCVKSGAGLTYLLSIENNYNLFPEVIIFDYFINKKYFSSDDLPILIPKIQDFTSIIIGPGLGNRPETINSVKELIENIKDIIPIVIDADAISSLDISKTYNKNLIITPHYGELGKLLNINYKEIKENPIYYSQLIAKNLNVNVILKGYPTIITNGEETFLNIFGNPALAKGGSGDVLSGIIGGILSKYPNFNILNNAAIAVLIHSLTAEHFIKSNSEETMLASDIINLLPKILP